MIRIFELQFLMSPGPPDRVLRGQSGAKWSEVDFTFAVNSGSQSKHEELRRLIFRAHNPKVAGSNPAPATTGINRLQ